MVFFLPETIHYKRSAELVGLNKKEYVQKIWQLTNPVRAVRLYRYPNLLIVVSNYQIPTEIQG